MIQAPTIVSWLESHREAMANFNRAYPGASFGTVEEFILEHGTPYGPRIELPEGIEYGKAKECYSNAFGVAHDHPDEYTYVEGFAYSPGSIAVPHAWLINERGEVLDVTWRDGGFECGFCFGTGKEEIDHICEGCDDDCDMGCTTEEKCFWCKGTGEQDFEHKSREGSEYLGIEVPLDKLVKILLSKGTYGVMDSPEFVQEVSTKEVQNV